MGDLLRESGRDATIVPARPPSSWEVFVGDGPYSRVYWTVMDDPKFDGIRESPRHFGAWALMLVVAEMAHPAPAFAPASIPKSSIQALADAGLVDVLSGGRYRIRGLAAEREMRSQNGRNAAAVRWHGKGNAEAMLAKQSKAETRRDEITPLPPTGGGSSRANGTSPRQLADAARVKEREILRQERMELRRMYDTGQLTETEYDERIADLGKQPDDLTRSHQ